MTVETSTWVTKKGLAQMLKGGVIMDVVTPEQARIAEDAGAVAVMALERVPADIRAAGGVARMSDPSMIEGIMNAVTIPVMAKARIGHFVEAQVLEALGVDYIDESEVLTPADEVNHIDKHQFKVPFVCGCRDLGEALRRIAEGAAMIRTKGEAGTGNIVEAVRHIRALQSGIRELAGKRPDELFVAAKELQAPIELVNEVAEAAASCPWSTSWPAASPPRRTRRSPCSSARRASSSGRASSSRRIPSARRAPSSRRPRISTIPRSSPRSPRDSERRCAASPSKRSRQRSGWRSAAGRRRSTAVGPHVP